MNILVKNHHNHDLQESVHFLNYTFVHEMQHEVPVLFHLFHYQAHIAAHHLFALGRQMFQAVNHKTSHRIIVLRRQFQIQDVIEVIQLHGTFHQTGC